MHITRSFLSHPQPLRGSILVLSSLSSFFLSFIFISHSLSSFLSLPLNFNQPPIIVFTLILKRGDKGFTWGGESLWNAHTRCLLQIFFNRIRHFPHPHGWDHRTSNAADEWHDGDQPCTQPTWWQVQYRYSSYHLISYHSWSPPSNPRFCHLTTSTLIRFIFFTSFYSPCLWFYTHLFRYFSFFSALSILALSMYLYFILGLIFVVIPST